MYRSLFVLLLLAPLTSQAHQADFIHAHPHGLEALSLLLLGGAVVVGLLYALRRRRR
jgi:hypothetical protein